MKQWHWVSAAISLVGMLLFGLSMGRAGIDGSPRRTDLGALGAYINPNWEPLLNWTAVAGVILLTSSVLLFVVLLGTWFSSKGEPKEPAPIVTTAPKESPLWLENWGLWAAIIIITNVVMWGPVLIQGLNFVTGFWSPGYQMQ